MAIHISGRPISPNEPISRQDLVSIDKLKAEGRMEEIKTDLGWRFDTWRLLIALPDDKFSAWTSRIRQILVDGHTTHAALDTIIGQLTHVTIILPYLLHFLSRLRSLKFVAS